MTNQIFTQRTQREKDQLWVPIPVGERSLLEVRDASLRKLRFSMTGRDLMS